MIEIKQFKIKQFRIMIIRIIIHIFKRESVNMLISNHNNNRSNNKTKNA